MIRSNQRRQILKASASAVTLAIVLGTQNAAFAQATIYNGIPRDAIDYRALDAKKPTDAPAGKIEVTEFFWFGCPHCNSLEPTLEAWLKKQDKDVVFKRVHIYFDENRTGPHQKLFYALQTLGIVEKMVPAVFTAIHGERKNLLKRDEVMDWAKTQPLLNTPAFAAAYDSFSTASEMRKATKLQEDYKVDGVPYIAVGGKYVSSPSIAAGMAGGVTPVLDFLVAKVRKENGGVKTADKPEVKPKNAPAKPATKPVSATPNPGY